MTKKLSTEEKLTRALVREISDTVNKEVIDGLMEAMCPDTLSIIRQFITDCGFTVQNSEGTCTAIHGNRKCVVKMWGPTMVRISNVHTEKPTRWTKIDLHDPKSLDRIKRRINAMKKTPCHCAPILDESVVLGEVQLPKAHDKTCPKTHTFKAKWTI